MPKGANQKLKTYYLAKILLEETDDEHGLNMQQIIDKLAEHEVGVERKTLYADFKALKEAGLDIIGVKTKDDYTYHIGARDFDLAEIKLMVDAISSTRFISEKKSNELIKKISGLVSKYDAKKLKRQVYLCGRPKADNDGILYNVDAVHEAISKGVKLKFIYNDWNINKEYVPRYDGKIYEISPWGLSYNDDFYYMIGYDEARDMMRHYRVDKMTQIEVTDIPRKGQNLAKDMEIGKYVTENFNMCGGDVLPVRIQMPESKCGIFIDRFGKGLKFRRISDDIVETTVEAAVSYNFYSWVFAIGEEVTIVGPDLVVKDIRGYLEMLTKKYS